MPMDVFLKVGLFDQRFFMYCEEVDLQKRVSQDGLKRQIIPGPQIIHLEGGSDGKNSKKRWSFARYSNVLKSKSIYMRKHNSLLIFQVYKWINLISYTPGIMARKGVKTSAKLHLLKTLVNS
jgi:GT2 family glycosyltransferase